MSYIKFFLKKKALLLKSIFLTNSHPGSCDSYSYKWNRLKEYAYKYKAKTLIETGTYYGITVDKMIPHFNEIYSIEIDTNLFNYNKRFYRASKNVNIRFGDSKFVLPEILSTFENNNYSGTIIFWLDGHCSENETGIGDEYSPIYKELETIISFDFLKAIIIVDDLRLFDGVNYPTFNKITSGLNLNKYEIIKDQDAFILIDSSLT